MSLSREMGLRFPKSARLFRASEFQRVRGEGVPVHGKFMLLSVLQNGAVGPARVGIITSRRVGGAAERNRVRRRLREILRAERGRLMPGAWLVIVVRQRAVEVEFSDLREEWLRLIRRTNVWSPEE